MRDRFASWMTHRLQRIGDRPANVNPYRFVQLARGARCGVNPEHIAFELQLEDAADPNERPVELGW